MSDRGGVAQGLVLDGSGSRSAVFYDLETTGADPVDARIVQFAGVRTNEDLEEEAHEVFRVRLDPDVVPSPAAMLVNGTTLETLEREGVSEREAVDRMRAFLDAPHTLRCGFNSIKYDDVLVRHALWRNLEHPYSGEGERLDVLTLFRAASVLDHEWMAWPEKESRGRMRPTYRLGALAGALGMSVVGLHDALTDVRTTLDLARVLASQAPEVWKHGLRCALGDPGREFMGGGEDVWLHAVHGGRTAGLGCRLLVSLGQGVWNGYGAAVSIAAAGDPKLLEGLDAHMARDRLTGKAKGKAARAPLAHVGCTNSAFLLNLSEAERSMPGIGGRAADRMGVPYALVSERADYVRARRQQFMGLVAEARGIAGGEDVEARDPEVRLYGEDLPGPDDWGRCDELLSQIEEGECPHADDLEDERLRVLAGRYMARRAPGLASVSALRDYEVHTESCLRNGFGSRPSAQQFRDQLTAEGQKGAGDPGVLEDLERYDRERLRPHRHGGERC